MPRRSRPGPTGIGFGSICRHEDTGDQFRAVLWRGQNIGMLARMRSGRVGAVGVVGQMLRIWGDCTGESLHGEGWRRICAATRQALAIAPESVIRLEAALRRP